jgi:hypothetical protein
VANYVRDTLTRGNYLLRPAYACRQAGKNSAGQD